MIKHLFHRMLPVLLILQMVFVLVSCGGGNGEPIFSLSEDGQGYVLAGVNGQAEGNVVIPELYEGLPVVEIGDDAFKMQTGITSVSIPATVRRIGHSSFYGCSGLRQITIAEKSALKSIEDWAFSGCFLLDSITLPEDLSYIGCSAFSACKRIEEIVIPEGVDYIGSFAFYSCSALEKVTLPDGIAKLGESAFSGTALYNTSENWVENVLYMGSYLIEARKNLSGTCTVRDGTKYIAEGAFKSCARVSGIEFPTSLLEIREWAFANCESLTRVLMPANLVYLGDHAFYNCSSLQSVRIPQNIHVIAPYTFAYCGFQVFVFSSNITEVSENAFTGCTGITAMLIPAGTPEKDESGTIIKDEAGNTVYVPDTGMQKICSGAFSGCSELRYIYYEGVPREYSRLNIESDKNDTFIKSLVLYYSENKPDEESGSAEWPYDTANYWWHYENGLPTPW